MSGCYGATLRPGGALERGDGGALEPLAQLCDAHGGVGAAATAAEATELVAVQAASKGGGGRGCQWGLARERALRCGGALERGDGASLEPLAQLCDALGGVSATATIGEAAEPVVTQAASKGEGGGGCQPRLTRERALRCGGALERGDCTALEPLAQLSDALGGVSAGAAMVADAAEPVASQAASKVGAEGGCRQQGPTRERALGCGGALERGDGAALEPFAQLGDALGGVGAFTIDAEAAELVAEQAASKGGGGGGCQQGPTRERALRCGGALE